MFTTNQETDTPMLPENQTVDDYIDEYIKAKFSGGSV